MSERIGADNLSLFVGSHTPLVSGLIGWLFAQTQTGARDPHSALQGVVFLLRFSVVVCIISLCSLLCSCTDDTPNSCNRFPRIL